MRRSGSQRNSCFRENAQMLGRAAPERRQRVSALERRHDAPVAMPARHVAELRASPRRSRPRTNSRPASGSSRCASNPAEIDHELRSVRLERWQPSRGHDGTERVAARTGRQRDVDHVRARSARRPSTDTADTGTSTPSARADRPRRSPRCRCHGARRNRRRRRAPVRAPPARARSPTADVVEQAEAHRALRFRVMAGRTHRAERRRALRRS